MDDVTQAFFELKFENSFIRARGDNFQAFFSSIMEKRYPGDFTRIRPWGAQGDEKCDGHLRSKGLLFQCYAPDEMTAAKCIAKINDDFAGAVGHWEGHFSTWVFVHNAKQGLGPKQTKRLLQLGKDHAPLVVTHWGYEEIRREAMQLPEVELASLLGPAPSRREITNLGLDSLVPVLDHVALMQPRPEPDLRPVPADKLEQNRLSEHVATLLKAGMSREQLVRRYFKLKPQLQDQIAEAFRLEYARLRATPVTPDAIFDALHRFAIGHLLPSAARESAVLAVLAFFFSECDVFERPLPAGGVT